MMSCMTDDHLAREDDRVAPISDAPCAPEGPERPDLLADYLAALRRDDCFRVDAVLKSSPVEETQLVYFVGVNGAEQGPYVRKLIDRDAGIGSVYRRLHDLRRGGRRLRYLPAVYDCHEAGGKQVVLMEHACGATLRELVAGEGEEGRAALVLRVFPALCDAVAELHGAFASPVVHRDLTPSNVVCPADDPSALTVVDLGIARTYKPEADADTAYFGTRPYAPPEQFGFGQTDVRTDVYALGMVLFFCLTGRDATRADRARRFADPAVPEPLRAVVSRAARLEPDGRYRDVPELKRAFGEAAACLAAPDGDRCGASACPEAPEGAESRPRRWPDWVGRAWNALVLAAYALLFAACVFAIVDPTPDNARWPQWFLVCSYAVVVNLTCALSAFLLLDRRRLGRRFPVLARRRPLRELLACLGVAAAVWTVYLAVGVFVQAGLD